jgi:hypothetical protein
MNSKVLLLFTCLWFVLGTEERGYIATKHTLVSPFLFGATSSLPYFEHGGSSIVTERFIRLTPAVKSRTGWIWNTEPLECKNWQVEVGINVHNTEAVGADGIAFWYQKSVKQEGSLMGNTENFDGIGILLDSFDNDADGGEPAIIGIKNNGQHVNWDYSHDFKGNQIDRCRVDFRRTGSDSTPFKLKIAYEKDTLTVSYDNYNTGDYHVCFSINNLNLPQGNYMGLTAITGGLADYHDVTSMTTRCLDPQAETQDSGTNYGFWDPMAFYRQYEEDRTKKAAEEKAHEAQHLAEREKLIEEERNERQRKEEASQHVMFEDYRQKLNNYQEDDKNKGSVAKKSGALILEALEQVTKTLQASSTKQDTNNINTRVQHLLDAQGLFQSSVHDFKENLKQEMASMVDGVKKETEKLVHDMKSLENILNHLTSHVGSLSEGQNRVKDEISSTREHVTETIKTGSGSSGFGFWGFFILFQIVFTAGIIYYQKFRDIKNQKIF